MSANTTVSTASHYIAQLVQDLPGKTLWLGLSTLWAGIPQMYLYAIGWLIIDLFTGLLKTYITGNHNISGKGREGILKFGIYLGTLSLAEYASRSWSMFAEHVKPFPLIGEYLSVGLLLVTAGLPFITSFLITHTETTSSLENLQAIAKHQGKSFVVLDLLIKILRVRGEEVIQKFTGTGPLNENKEETNDQRIEP